MRDPDPPEVLDRFHGELELVNIIAGQVARSVGSIAEYDDLLSAGREGLLDAARRYDPSRGIPFRVYANYRVRGAMFDGVRRMSALPRRAYERLAALEAATLVSEGEAEHSLTGAAQSTGEAEQALSDHLAAMATAAAVGVIAETIRGEAVAAEGSPGADPEEAFAKAELLALVRRVLRDFSAEESTLIQRHYFDGQRLEDIANDLDMSKSWASRIHTRAMARLTKRLRAAV